MTDEDVHLLNTGRHAARDLNAKVAQSRERALAITGPADDLDAHFSGLFRRTENIGARPARCDCDQDVPRFTVGLNLTGVHDIKAVVIPDGGHHSRIRVKCEGRQGTPLHEESTYELSGDVLGISRATPVAAKHDRSAIAQAFGHHFGRFLDIFGDAVRRFDGGLMVLQDSFDFREI